MRFLSKTIEKKEWDLLRSLMHRSRLPLYVIGDFNDLLSLDEKFGGMEYPLWLLTGFRRQRDIAMEGYLFTWSRGRWRTEMIEEWLGYCHPILDG